MARIDYWNWLHYTVGSVPQTHPFIASMGMSLECGMVQLIYIPSPILSTIYIIANIMLPRFRELANFLQ